ncbi:jerky protein homolog-like, partial [Zerene cesonia]|uniref:jerky protein homolog-like n=1 Tax=Zerene cesonia TaxID=33412 RepID=UPI0018E58D8D
SEIFIDWYDNTFIPEVKKRQNEIGKEGNVLLLLDNAPTHPSAELLERENGKFKAKFLPPNVTSLLQPMDQSVIETLKRLYRKQLLRRLLSVEEDNVEVVLSFFKGMNLKECCYMVVDAWDLIERKTLNKAWNRVLNRENENSITNSDDSMLEEINDLMLKIQICKDCYDSDLKEWVTCDSNDQGFQIMSDDEIVENILQRNEQQEMQEDETEENLEVENDAGPSHDEALHALETALKWFEKQTESDTASLLQLKRIRDIAAIKRRSGLRQMTITKYFKSH